MLIAACLVLVAGASTDSGQVRASMTPDPAAAPQAEAFGVCHYDDFPIGGYLFADDFETDKGWVRNPDGTDTATAGRWERGVPEEVDYFGPKQLSYGVLVPHDVLSGLPKGLVTGRLAGAWPGEYDLDGLTSIQSPPISLTGGSNYTLSFCYYLAHDSNASSKDFFRVQVVSGGTTTTVFEKLGSATNVNAVWTLQTVNLTPFAGQTIRFILLGMGSVGVARLVEAAVDDVQVTR